MSLFSILSSRVHQELRESISKNADARQMLKADFHSRHLTFDPQSG